MSGEGKRFKDAGYNTPKPLIEIFEEPMFFSSMKKFPDCDKWIFTINKEIHNHSKFQNFIKTFSEPYDIVVIDKLSDGQATSCKIAIENLKNSDSFFVGSCDTIFKNKLDIKELSSSEVTVLTSRPTFLQQKNSQGYGWVVEDKNNFEILCKEKVTITSNNFFIILGYFYFQKKSDFLNWYDFIRKNKIYINNELYIDVLVRELVSSKLTVSNKIVDSDIVGTPEEYMNYINKDE